MWEPAGHRVLVRPDKQADRTPGGLFVPIETKERKMVENIFGTVVAIGPNAWKAFDGGNPWAKVGDRVTFAKYAGFVFEDPKSKEQFRLLNDDDITMVENKE